MHPPTAVTHCTSAWLTQPPPAVQRGGGAGSGAAAASFPDLVVLRSTQLEVYSVHTLAAAPAGADGGEAAASLELLCSSQLFGMAESVAVLQGRAPGQRDALLLTFRWVGGAQALGAPQAEGAGPLLLLSWHAPRACFGRRGASSRRC